MDRKHHLRVTLQPEGDPGGLWKKSFGHMICNPGYAGLGNICSSDPGQVRTDPSFTLLSCKMAVTSFPEKDLMIDLSIEEQRPSAKMSQHGASSIFTKGKVNFPLKSTPFPLKSALQAAWGLVYSISTLSANSPFLNVLTMPTAHLKKAIWFSRNLLFSLKYTG